MESWLEITIAIVGLLGTVLGVLGISGYLGERAKHKAELKNKEEDQAVEEKRTAAEQRLKVTVRDVFKEEVHPINAKLDNITKEIEEIKSDLADNTVGTVTLLRDRMKAILDECREAKFASTGTKANWHELYNTYRSLGGNHFREYVDAWKQELEELPTSAPVTAPRGRRPSRAVVDLLNARSPVDNIGLPEELKDLTSTKNDKK